MPTAESLAAFYAGSGELVRATVPDPGAGVDFSLSVPLGRCWRLMTGSFTFTADATIVNRVPILQMTSGGLIVFQTPYGGSFVPAGVLRRYSVAANLGYQNLTAIFGVLGGFTCGLPGNRFLPGSAA